MKLLTAMILFWALTSSTLWARNGLDSDQSQGVSSPNPSQSVLNPGQNPGDLSPNQKWVEQIDGSFAIPSFTAAVEPNPGLGGDINIGYRFDKTWAVFIGTGYYQYSLSSGTPGSSAFLSYIPLVGILRMAFGDGPFRPYVFGGAGIALNSYVQNNAPGSPVLKISNAETDFYLAPGLGVLYRFSSDMAFFLQARIDLDYTSQKGLGVFLDNPSVFIPIQAGISFSAL
jgi:hypothetical protein